MVAVVGRGWRLAPCLIAMFDEADRRWPERSRRSDGSIGNAAHAARASDHNPSSTGYVTAGDLTDDKANGCDADLFAEHLRTARDKRVKYVISNERIFRSYGLRAWEWTPYTGSNPHDKHTHISVLDTEWARNDTSPWFPYADAPDPLKPAPPREEDDDMAKLIIAKPGEVPEPRPVWATDGIFRWWVRNEHVQNWMSDLLGQAKPKEVPAGLISELRPVPGSKLPDGSVAT